MKKLLPLALLMTLLSACGDSSQSTLDKFIKAKQQGQHEAVYALHASQDQTAKTQQAYLEEQSNPMTGLAQLVASQTQYKILSVEEQGNTATAQVEFDQPDYSKLMGEMMGDLFKTAFSGGKKNAEQAQKDMEQKLVERAKQAGDLPRIKRTETIQLVKEDGKWKILENWEQQKRIESLITEGQALERKEDWQAAKAKYDEILSLKSTDKRAQEKSELMGKKLAAKQAHQAYMPKLELKEIRVETSGDYFVTTALRGKVKNTGDRTLMKLEITVYYLDAQGKAIFEETHLPVLAFDAKDQDELLKPGYIDEFAYRVDKAPSEWKGKVKVEISDLKFVDEPDTSESLF